VAFQSELALIARMSDHELWMAFFQDPDGHQLALMTEKR
jgi:methylmalonyl-CoA/ethylmalonyl-CoA epimerase